MISPTYRGNFQQFTGLLDSNNIPYCVMAGTLLGTIRTGDFIEHDEDIDITVNVKYKQQVIDLINNSSWEFYAYWRMEFGIVRHNYPKSESKIDIFFYDSDEKYSYIYSYKKNPMHGIWDIEWRMKFPLGVFDEIKRWKIDDIPIFMPIRAEEILKIEYGPNWKKLDSKWNTYNAPAYDKTYREIAIIIPTFLRPEKLQILVKTIQTTFNNEWYRIYIADQGLYNPDTEKFYNTLRKQGHFCTYLPFNCGLSYCRNYLVQKSTEPFVLIVDDDFICTPKTNLSNFIAILNSDSKLGVVGGELLGHQSYHYDLFHDTEHNKLYYIKLTAHNIERTWKTVVQPRIDFLYKDIVLNFALFKREVFNNVQWDNNLKLCEHTDFYLQLKKSKKWKVAFTDTVIIQHQTTNNNAKYADYRRNINNKQGFDLLCKKWKFINENDFIYLKEN